MEEKPTVLKKSNTVSIDDEVYVNEYEPYRCVSKKDAGTFLFELQFSKKFE